MIMKPLLPMNCSLNKGCFFAQVGELLLCLFNNILKTPGELA